MDEIKQCRTIISQLRQLIPFIKPHERPEIQALIRKRTIRLVLLMLQKDLEAAVDGSFDPVISRKLEAAGVLLLDHES